jgi:hypothetical protein
VALNKPVGSRTRLFCLKNSCCCRFSARSHICRRHQAVKNFKRLAKSSEVVLIGRVDVGSLPVSQEGATHSDHSIGRSKPVAEGRLGVSLDGPVFVVEVFQWQFYCRRNTDRQTRDMEGGNKTGGKKTGGAKMTLAPPALIPVKQYYLDWPIM